MESQVQFYLNGKKQIVNNVPPSTRLLDYLKSIGLQGTREACGEGECGSCTVMVSYFDKNENKVIHKNINSCTALVYAMDGLSITTIEGVGNVKKLHPIQEQFVSHHATQCGFCTPGMVMSTLTLLQNKKDPTEIEIEEALEGNLCRCTGYRPILDASKTFCVDKPSEKKGICPNSGLPCKCHAEDKPIEPVNLPEELYKFTPKNILIEHKKGKWFRPVDLKSLLEFKAKHPEAVLVAGNTGLGIETHYNFLDETLVINDYICVNKVAELLEIKAEKDGITIGGSATVTHVMEFLKSLEEKATKNQKIQISELLHQLKNFAGPQLRNVASIAGNLITNHPPTELAPYWAGLNAKVNLINVDGTIRTIPLSQLYENKGQIDMKKEELIHSLYIPLVEENEYFQCYKQSQRHEHGEAHVNAGIRMKLKNGVVEDCTISFGGFDNKVTLAKKTAEFLKGKKFDDSTFEEAVSIMSKEIVLPEIYGRKEYKLTLAISFFFKFFLYIKKELQGLDPALESTLTKRHVVHKEATQFYTEYKKGTSVGQSHITLSAKQLATGEAKYTQDLKVHGMKYGQFVLTSIPAGIIKKVDASEALKMEGVRAFISAKDVPGTNVYGLGADEEVFVSKEVVSIGLPIGLIVADTMEQAQAAAKAVIVEYEEHEPIVTIQDAIKKESYLGNRHFTERGNVDEAWKDCDQILEGETFMGGQTHVYMETQNSLAVPGEDQEITVYPSSQAICDIQAQIAKALNIASNKVTCICRRLGGGFGGRQTRNSMVSLPTAVAAYVSGLPIYVSFTRNDNFKSFAGRHPAYSKYKVGFKNDGSIHAVDIKVYTNGGCSLDVSQPILDIVLQNSDGCYHIPHFRCEGRICKTNTPSNTAFRAFGNPQGHFIIDSIIDHVASTLKMSPHELRKRHLYRPGLCTTLYGQEITAVNSIQRCWDMVYEKSDFENKLKEIEKFNKENKYKKRGIAIKPLKYGIGFDVSLLNQGSALVHIHNDGSVLVTTGGIEMGQGLYTKIASVVATTLNVPITDVYIKETATDKVPNNPPTAASLGSDLYAGAAYEAAKILNERLKPYRERFGNDMKKIALHAWLECVHLSAVGHMMLPLDIIVAYDEKDRIKAKVWYHIVGCGVSEVEIDTLTGDFTILRSDICMDIGDSINPAIDIGQIEGAFMQGVGLFTMEEVNFGHDDMKWIKKGHLENSSLRKYSIPTVKDVPQSFHVYILPDGQAPKAVYRSKAVGEPPLLTSMSVFFAIKEAIKAARRDNGLDEYFALDAPATPERIRMACGDKLVQTVLKDKYKTFRPIGSY